MKTITVSSRARAVIALLKQASKENLIIRALDGREYILAEIDDFERKVELVRQNEELMHLLDERGKQKATIPLSQARAKFGV